MAIILQDDFETYANNSTISGQGGWVGGGANFVTNSQAFTGVQSLAIVPANVSTYSLPPTNTIYTKASIYVDDLNSSPYFGFKLGFSTFYLVQLSPSSNSINLLPGGLLPTIPLSTCSINTWYTIEIEATNTTSIVPPPGLRARVNGGAWTVTNGLSTGALADGAQIAQSAGFTFSYLDSIAYYNTTYDMAVGSQDNAIASFGGV